MNELAFSTREEATGHGARTSFAGERVPFMAQLDAPGATDLRKEGGGQGDLAAAGAEVHEDIVALKFEVVEEPERRCGLELSIGIGSPTSFDGPRVRA